MKKVVLVCRACVMNRIMECLEVPLRELVGPDFSISHSGFNVQELAHATAGKPADYIAFVYPQDLNFEGAEALNATYAYGKVHHDTPFRIYLESELYALPRAIVKKDERQRAPVVKRLEVMLASRDLVVEELDDFPTPSDPSDKLN